MKLPDWAKTAIAVAILAGLFACFVNACAADRVTIQDDMSQRHG